jgi:UPF0176 protein
MQQILLYYKYVPVADPEKMTREHKKLCTRLGLKGRIIIAKEGINGTVEGTPEATEEYMQEVRKIPEFSDIKFKKSPGTTDGTAFPKLSIKCRDEVVTLGRPGLFPVAEKTGGNYLSADELHKWYENKDDFVVLDMRNDYELKVGKFKDTLELPIGNFREIPQYAAQLEKLKNKKVVAVCTGGIRCEKGTAYLKQELGFENIYQLHDGIVTYMEKYPEGHFKGSLYVFDSRITMRTPGMPEEVIGVCELCKTKTETMLNCSVKGCHKHFVACEKCIETAGGREKIVCTDKHQN